MLMLIILFAAMRYEVGWDYNMYCKVVRTSIEWNNENTSRFSYPWRELFRFAHNYNIPHIAIIIPNIATYIILYMGICLLKLNNRQKVQVLLVYVMWYELYLGSFSIIRQQISMSLGFLMFALIQRKKFILSIVALTLSAWLHSSATILTLLYPVYLLRNKINLRWILISTAIMISALLSSTFLLANLSLVDMSKYDAYLKPSDDTGGKIIYVNIILSAYLLYVFYKSKKISDVNKQCYLLTITSLLGNVTIFLMGISSVTSRILSYFIIFITPILLPSLKIFKGSKYIRPIAISILIAFFFVYLYISLKGTKLASSGYVPYKFIFENL